MTTLNSRIEGLSMPVQRCSGATRVQDWLIRGLLTLLPLAVCADSVRAQLPQIRLNAVFPPGGQRGTTYELHVSAGADLDEADTLVFSHPGIRAVQRLNADGTAVAGRFIVSVEAAVPPGPYEVRLHGLFGISNPRTLRIDALPESAETEPNQDAATAPLLLANSVTNARSDGAGDVDCFRIQSRPGQPIVVRAEASLPGSPMQPVIELTDPAGRQLAVSRRVLTQDAAIVFEPSSDEDLVIRVRDAVYAGGQDYVYRLIVETRPFVEFARLDPDSAETDSALQLYGRHIPGGQPTDFLIEGQPVYGTTIPLSDVTLLQRLPEPGPDSGAPESLVTGSVATGALLQFVQPPGSVMSESGSGPVAVSQYPMLVQGAFESRNDVDEIRLTATAGQQLSIRVLSQRVGSIADPVLFVEQVIPATDTAAESFTRLATEDDDRQNPGGNNLPTVSADPSFLLTAPADGQYRVLLSDRYSASRGDARLAWYLSIAEAGPDFELMVFDAIIPQDENQPSSAGAASIRRGGSYPLAVYAWRTPDCTGPIELTIPDLPPGLTCPVSVIPEGQTVGKLVISADKDIAPGVHSALRVAGRTVVNDTALQRTALVASLVHDAVNGLPRTVTHSETLTVGIMKDEQPFSIQLETPAQVVSQDQQLLIPIRVERRNGFDDKVDVVWSGVPGNVDAPNVTIPKGESRITARFFFKENASVQTATILAAGTATVPYRRNPWLEERARAAVDEVQKILTAGQEQLAARQSAAAAATEQLNAAMSQIVSLKTMLTAAMEQQQTLTADFAKAQEGLKSAGTEVATQQKVLAGLQVSADLPAEQIAAAVQSVAAASQIAQAAADQVAQVSVQLETLSRQIESLKADYRNRQQQIDRTTSEVARLEQSVAAAQETVVAAEAAVKDAEAGRAAAEATANQAAEATKPGNVNVKITSAPVVLTIRPAIAKIAVEVPGGGMIPAGAALDLKVSVSRRNDFAGPLQLTLWQPADGTGLSCDPVSVPPDQNEAILHVTAAADAQEGAPPNLVVRAVGVVGDTEQVSDTPVSLTVGKSAK